MSDIEYGDFTDAPMLLVYVDCEGDKHYQPWEDLVMAGTLIDPYDGEDMQIIGWVPSIE